MGDDGTNRPDDSALEQAAALLLESEYDAAAALLRTWTSEHPDDLDAWFLCAWASPVLAPMERAAVAGRLNRLAPGVGMGHLLRSNVLDEPGGQDPLDAMQRALQLTPELTPDGLKKPDWVVRDLPPLPEPLASPAPVSVDFLRRRILPSYATDDFRKVSIDARAWTQLDPEDPLAWRTLALANLATGHLDRAADAARHLLRLFPGDPDAQALDAECRSGLGLTGHPDGLPLGMDPIAGEGDAGPLFVLEYQPGADLDHHLAFADTVLLEDPGSVDGWWMRSWLTGPDQDAHEQRPDEHEAASRGLIAVAPHVRHGYIALSRALASRDDLAGAFEVAEAGLRWAPTAVLPPRPDRPVVPTSAPLWTELMRRHCDLAWPDLATDGNWVQLMPMAQTWAQLDPTTVDPLLFVSSASRGLGRTEQATVALERARALDPTNRSVRSLQRLDTLRRVDREGFHPGVPARLIAWFALSAVSLLFLLVRAVGEDAGDPVSKPVAILLMTPPMVGALVMRRAIPDGETMGSFYRGLPLKLRLGTMVAIFLTVAIALVVLAIS